MKKKIKFLALLLLITAGCGACTSINRTLQDDVEAIAEGMCRNLEAMHMLRDADPADTALIRSLQKTTEETQQLMTDLYQGLSAKYKDELKDPEFNKKFSKHLSDAMLKCPHLTEEDRATFGN